MAFLSGYNRRKALTFNADAFISGDLTDQSVVVHMDNGETDFWDNSPPVAGTGVRFTLSDGTTLLKFEVESYDATGDDGWWHVKIPTLSSSVDTILYVYYDADSESDGSDKENVWDSDFKAVYHLNADKAEGLGDDSTSNNNDGTNSGSTDALGQVDRGRSFDGINDDISISDDDTLSAEVGGTDQKCAWTGWINMVDASGFNMLCKGTGAGREWRFGFTGSDFFAVNLWETNSDTINRTADVASTADEGGLVFFGAIYDGSAVNSGITLYKNGSVWASTGGGAGTYTNATNKAVGGVIGQFMTDTGTYAEGINDEITFSRGSTVRSADWMTAMYQSGLGTWLTIGATETEAVTFIGKVIWF